MAKIEINKEELKRSQAIGSMFNSIFGNSLSQNWLFTQSEIDLMLLDSTIKQEIDKRKRGVNGRNIVIEGEQGATLTMLQEQFKSINTRSINDIIIDSQFTGYSVQEIMYNDSLTMKKLNEKPRRWYMQQWNGDTKTYDWILNYNGFSGANSGSVLPDLKYLIAINRPNDQYPSGRSELEPIYQWWKIKENSLTYANKIVEKYGGIITWFLYNSELSETEIAAQAKTITEMADGSAIAIPEAPGGEAQGLDHEFGFISTEKLTNDLHMNLIKFCDGKIAEYLTGSSISSNIGESGSYSSANAGLELLESTVESDVAYCEEWLNLIVHYQALIHGFDYTKYSVQLNKKPNPLEKAGINKAKLENYNQVKTLGYSISKEYLAEQTGIPLEALQELLLTTSQTQEFEKKKSINDLKLKEKKLNAAIEEATKINSSIFSEELTKLYIDAYSKVKTKEDLKNVSVNFVNTNLDERLMIAKMFGIYSQIRYDELEFAEESYTVTELLTLPFDEAIKFFVAKVPRLFEEIEELTAQSIEKTFWVKKLTDRQVVAKVQKALEKNLELGGTFSDFKKEIGTVLEKAGVSKNGYYLENVYRTNEMSSYNAGRQEQQELTKDVFEYWLYNAIEDDRTSKICNNLDGKVFKSDDPIWGTIYPPNHFSCRSVVTALTEGMLEEYNIDTDVDMEEVNKALGELNKTTFNNSPINSLQTLQTAEKV